MRIAVVRGGHLKSCELQSFEPLAGTHDLTAYGPLRDRGAGSELDCPVRRLFTPEDASRYLPGAVSLPVRFALSRTGWNGGMRGLSSHLEDVDVAHAKGITRGSTWQCVDAKRRNPELRVVVTVAQNIPHHRPTRFGLTAGNEAKRTEVLRRADAFVAVTERARLALELEGVERERIRVIPYGLDLDRFSAGEPSEELLGERRRADDGLDLLFVGHSGWGKGLGFLLFALARLEEARDGGDAPLLHVVGSEGDSSRIRRILRHQDLEDRVIFHGRMPYSRMPEVYASADAMVVPSVPKRRWQEQFGFVIAEAMACGVPVVGARSGSIPEVVGEAGLLVQPADVLDLAEALQLLAGDDDLRSELSRRGRRKAEEAWDQRRIAGRYEALYESIARGGGV